MHDRILIQEFGQGRRALRQLREHVSDHLCDVFTPGPQDDFSVRSKIIPVDRTPLIDARVGAVQYDRTPRHIARGGIDHYQIGLCVDGQMTYAAGRRSVTLREGDLCLMDMAQPSRTVLTAGRNSRRSRNVAITLPRSSLAPLLAAPDGASASLISGDSRHGRLLAEHFLAICKNGGALSLGTAVPGSDALAGLVADAVGRASDADVAVDRANRDVLLASIKRHIDANLQTEAVSVAQICRRFALSRATLYRLFEPEGGLWRYIQEQRLSRAFARLASPGAARTRIIDLAVDLQFASDTTFVRAFRRRFGITPGEVRGLSALNAKPLLGNGAKMSDALLWLWRLAREQQ
jgi:AraC-like DNA-binding protein